MRPASISSFVTVLIDTPTTRETERMEDPSTSMERIWTLVSTGNLFMPPSVTGLDYMSSIYFILVRWANVPIESKIKVFYIESV